MPLERELQLLRGDAGAVIGDAELGVEGALDAHLDGLGPGVERVLHQLLERRERPLDDLPGGDARRRLGREPADRLGHGASGWAGEHAGRHAEGQAPDVPPPPSSASQMSADVRNASASSGPASVTE